MGGGPPLLVSYYPVRDTGGRRCCWVGAVVVDITERKRTEEELRRAAEFRERFLGIVSHDLRNPLNAILLSANALLRAEDLAEQHLKAVRRITTSAERMARMIGDLLDFTRGRLGGGIPVHPERRATCATCCRHVLEELEAGHPGRELRLEAEGDFEGEWDADRLAQVMGNLGKNALDYSPEGHARVRFGCATRAGACAWRCTTRARPFRPELLPRIFEPFRRRRGAAAHPTSGLGLGLYIVQQIVRGARGQPSRCAPREEEGTTFTVRLPRTPGGPSPAP